jgi:hypothetical protein
LRGALARQAKGRLTEHSETIRREAQSAAKDGRRNIRNIRNIEEVGAHTIGAILESHPMI